MTAALLPPAAAFSAASVVTVCGVALPPPVVPLPVAAHPTSALAAGGAVQLEPPAPAVPVPVVPPVPAVPVPAAPPRPARPVPAAPPRPAAAAPAVPVVPAEPE